MNRIFHSKSRNYDSLVNKKIDLQSFEREYSILQELISVYPSIYSLDNEDIELFITFIRILRSKSYAIISVMASINSIIEHFDWYLKRKVRYSRLKYLYKICSRITYMFEIKTKTRDGNYLFNIAKFEETHLLNLDELKSLIFVSDHNDECSKDLVQKDCEMLAAMKEVFLKTAIEFYSILFENINIIQNYKSPPNCCQVLSLIYQYLS